MELFAVFERHGVFDCERSHKKEFCLYGAKNMILTVSIDWEENDFWGREQVFF